MPEIPDSLKGILLKGNTKESLEATRNFIGAVLDSNWCQHCERSGPDPKDVASLTRQLVMVLKEIEECERETGPVGVVRDLDSLRDKMAKRTGFGTQKPESIARRQGGRHPKGG